MVFTLKLFDTKLLRFSAEPKSSDPGYKIIWIDESKKNLLPMDLIPTEESLASWIRKRNIPKNRAFVDSFLAKNGLSANRPLGIITVSKGLSLNDSYWITEEGFEGTFENCNLYKNQPLSAPNDVRRYFVTPKEAGELCLMSCLLGENRDLFFPKLDHDLNLITFSSIAEKYLMNLGYEPVQCATEYEARARVTELKVQHKYPVYFFKSDTTGEKDFEEFYTANEKIVMDKFDSLGVIKNEVCYDEKMLQYFTGTISTMKKKGEWTRTELIELFNKMIPNFNHKETGKFLDSRM